MRLSPFDGYLVRAEQASEVISPAYDALTPAQRHEFATAHPRNYLNVMRSREEFPTGKCPSLDDLLTGNAGRLRCMMEAGDFEHHQRPVFFIYRLAKGGHSQTGVVAETPINEYEKGLIKKHERTTTGKEDDLTHYQRRVRASSSPICLAYPQDPNIDDYVLSLISRTPSIDLRDEDGLQQTVWTIDDKPSIAEIERLFAGVPASYLTDGHHRAESAARFRAIERDANAAHTGDEPYNHLLVACFPSNQLRILEYNRCVSGLNGHTPDRVLRMLKASFSVEAFEVSEAQDVRPRTRGEFSMFLKGTWYRLTARDEVIGAGALIDCLDVSILQDRVLGPILGIEDPRVDARMRYLSGAFDMNQLQSHCRAHDLIGFAVYPTAIEDLMAVADAGEVMPPKSTWFEPKLRSGVFIRMR